MSESRTQKTFAPPVMAARSWLTGVHFSKDQPLLNVSQAAPTAPPPPPMLAAIADTVLNDPEAHLYGPVLGLPELRREIAQQWSLAYGGQIGAEQVAITSGCNQAFAAAIALLCGEASEVILPLPYYFNHAMWLDLSGVRLVGLPTGPELLPDIDKAAALITSKTRAIALVSPNNPGGVEYPPALLEAFFELCKSRGIALILDETYRDFDSREGAPHGLFARADWPETFIQLYSFSKAYRLTGHRVGAMIASTARLAEAEKFLDTVAICPNQIGQRAALWGMQNLGDWLAAERLEILDRRAAIHDGFELLADKGWKLLGCGAYFAYLEQPFDIASDVLARRLVAEAGILLLPGTMLQPKDQPIGAKQLRIAFANVDRAAIHVLFKRLSRWQP